MSVMTVCAWYGIEACSLHLGLVIKTKQVYTKFWGDSGFGLSI
jgi:hypothetical protein